MDFIVSIYPGLGLACTLVFLGLGVGQFWIYKNQGHQRSRDLAQFCFFGGIFALNIAVSHSRSFSDEFTWFYVIGLQFAMFAMFYFYLKSLGYFLAIPLWLKRLYNLTQLVLGLVSVTIAILYYTTGVDYFFNPDSILTTGNFFMDSYSTRFGAPRPLAQVLLGISSLVNIVTAGVLLRIVYLGSRDSFFLAGLAMTILCLGVEHLFLPWTLAYYLPLLFMSNMLEALRMAFLCTEEESLMAQDAQLRATVAASDEPYQSASLSEERIQRLKVRLQALMEEQKLYENPNLSLEDLAHEIGIPSYQLTQVIRFGLRMNFYEMINSYRIEQVKRLLQDESHRNETILDLAIKSGFNSKSSFNAAFKKMTGQTPSEYRKN